MRRSFCALIVILAGGVCAMAADGLTTIASNYDPAETVKRLESAIKARGMTLFARVDHAAGAKEAGMELRPTEVLIFGSAKAGTPLMEAQQTIGIDLPLKALVWQDAAGKTWISWNEPEWLAMRHGLTVGARPSVGKMREVVSEVAHEAAGIK
jgi:uncharacterized protein (DUF302 family)